MTMKQHIPEQIFIDVLVINVQNIIALSFSGFSLSWI